MPEPESKVEQAMERFEFVLREWGILREACWGFSHRQLTSDEVLWLIGWLKDHTDTSDFPEAVGKLREVVTRSAKDSNIDVNERCEIEGVVREIAMTQFEFEQCPSCRGRFREWKVTIVEKEEGYTSYYRCPYCNAECIHQKRVRYLGRILSCAVTAVMVFLLIANAIPEQEKKNISTKKAARAPKPMDPKAAPAPQPMDPVVKIALLSPTPQLSSSTKPAQPLTPENAQNIWSEHLTAPVNYSNRFGIRLALIPPGTMEVDGRMLKLSKPYYCGVYEITESQFAQISGSLLARMSGGLGTRKDWPKTLVKWKAARDFCEKLTKAARRRGLKGSYRLPNESEWEYACRAGSATRYCFGEDAIELSNYAWFDSGLRLNAIGGKKANKWGLHDMHGNAGEFCGNLFSSEPYSNETAVLSPKELLNLRIDNLRIETGRHLSVVVRGGTVLSDADQCTSSARIGHPYSSANLRIGFRIVLVDFDPASLEAKKTVTLEKEADPISKLPSFD